MRTCKFLLIAAAACTFVFVRCKKSSSASSESNSTTYNIRMTDAPGNFQQVNVEIVGAEVHSDETDGWVALNVHEGIYNLLDFSNGKDTLIASGSVATGIVSQIRLILGTHNTVMVDSQVYNLETPSAQQSGLKLQVHHELSKGIDYNVVLDFDAAKSIVLTGSNKYMLKPVIRTIVKALNGAIQGTVNPAASRPAVWAVSATDT